MYLNNTSITFHFVLQPSATPPAQTTYDIRITAPDGTVTYTDDALLTYVAPTATAQGSATYAHTVNAVGVWRFELCSGTKGVETVFQARDIFVCASLLTPPAVGLIERRVFINAVV